MSIPHKDRVNQLQNMLTRHGVLNASQACRLLNGHDIDEYDVCYFSFQEKPKGATGPLACKNRLARCCQIDRRRVLYSLIKMCPPAKTAKLRFRDHGGIGSDIFRFFYLSDQEFKRRILDQAKPEWIAQAKKKGWLP